MGQFKTSDLGRSRKSEHALPEVVADVAIYMTLVMHVYLAVHMEAAAGSLYH